MKLLLRIVLYLTVFTIFVGGIGWIGYTKSQSNFLLSYRDTPIPLIKELKKPQYDPKKPTVAVLLGDRMTEAFDFLGPYEVFAMTNSYNVFAVAPDNKVKSLTGGLDIVPHYSFRELKDLLGHSPDIIVVPNIRIVDKKSYEPVRKWIQENYTNNNTILSICSGSRNLADAGLLDGKEAAAHWSNIGQRIKDYPSTKWKRDQRYVKDGNIISSAGLSSGIDASLYVISQNLGNSVSQKVAKLLNYPNYSFVNNPKITPYYFGAEDSVFPLNQAFQWNKYKTGVLLYNNMGIGEVASIIDIFGNIGSDKIFTISNSEQPIVTKYGLNLLARYSMNNAPRLDRLMLAGSEAKSIASNEIEIWEDIGNINELIFMHSGSANRYVYEAPFEYLAKQEGIQTAKYAIKRFEYRGNNLKLEGKSLSIEIYGNLFLICIISLIISLIIDKSLFRNKNLVRKSKQKQSM
ncbi:DJ-1/PfpI family protein [Robertmurraya kyonggiensis]|uniref:DJ-1/PfpI family protein n=1 Tax=Robertmurraya kyonggiensis TaxID=1037680 RepID=A0A4U1DD68_9BACI|nr:DJ-1/PfpI family protein [Robertmurraya kyonggiensis]